MKVEMTLHCSDTSFTKVEMTFHCSDTMYIHTSFIQKHDIVRNIYSFTHGMEACVCNT
jgi:hypothetical protein